MSISNGATVVDRTYQDNNNNLKFNSMIKFISKQQPMTKIGTKEKELKYFLNLVLPVMMVTETLMGVAVAPVVI